MNADFHYYATWCAALLAGFTHEESCAIAYSDNFVDACSRSLLSRIGGPSAAATTQLALEMMDARTDIIGLQDITRIWASFHFLPKDLHASPGTDRRYTKKYLSKYRLICGPNSDLMERTVELAKGKSLQAIGVAMHVLCDTWAHQHFAGTPSMVINNVLDSYVYELVPEGDGYRDVKPSFRHSASAPDDIENRIYTHSLNSGSENSIMNLGHGRAGHLPDYSFIRYRYLPAWGNFEEIIKDNPSDFKNAFCQMIQALKYLHGDLETFSRGEYAYDVIADLEPDIDEILKKRQPDAGEDWLSLGKQISNCEIDPFDTDTYIEEYTKANEKEKDDTFLGRFIVAALAQKSMVTGQIYHSGNKLAGRIVDYQKDGFGGMKDYKKLVRDEDTES
ncbi:MAG: hypothetical protein IKQ97_01885 [Eubacterium sp.]|nr:hypothetical protein [Eubacterium sp.]